MNNRDSERLKKIRLMICCACGADAPSQAAHSNFMCHGKGRGIKADDKYTIPLCHSCHGDLDQNLSQQTRQQQLDWFTEKLDSTNETLKRAEDAVIHNYPESF
ncbi:DUF968 domain-containing protein [Psychrobacter glaciei]|uniref:DUF968 domain-containing protein n=1 Tax=Psychrobacter glaciei TaxID=619771 RepID=UPI003F48D08F